MKYMIFILTLTLILNWLMFTLAKNSNVNKEKSNMFECGFDPYMMTRTPFSLQFFKIAIIFLIFDIEIILILPLPLIINTMNNTYFISSFIIILVILFGLIYEWYQGSLNWI